MINTCIKLFDLTSASNDWGIAADWLEDQNHPLAQVFRTGHYCLWDPVTSGSGTGNGNGHGSGFGGGDFSGDSYTSGDSGGDGGGMGDGAGTACGAGNGTGRGWGTIYWRGDE